MTREIFTRYSAPIGLRKVKLRVNGLIFHAPNDSTKWNSESGCSLCIPGKLKRVKYTYNDSSIESVLDRLPTAQTIGKNDDGSVTIIAESYGDGIDMWLRSQSEWAKLLDERAIYVYEIIYNRYNGK